MNEQQTYDVWTDRVEVSRRFWRGVAVLFMVGLAFSILILLSSGPYHQTGHPCCSAESCKEMHK